MSKCKPIFSLITGYIITEDVKLLFFWLIIPNILEVSGQSVVIASHAPRLNGF